jgi:hypothetical protein
MYGCIRPCMAHSGRGWEDREAACRGRLCGDVPFEFVGEVARASALAETSHVEGGAAAARHVDGVVVGERESDGGGGGCRVVGGDVSNGKLKDGFQPRFGRSRGRATSIASTKSYRAIVLPFFHKDKRSQPRLDDVSAFQQQLIKLFQSLGSLVPYEYSLCKGHAATQQMPTMRLQPFTPYLDAKSGRIS